MRITLLKRLREYRGEKERWYIGEVWCKFWRQNQLGVSLHYSKLRILWSVHFTMYSATVFALFKLYLHYICTEYFCTEYYAQNTMHKIRLHRTLLHRILLHRIRLQFQQSKAASPPQVGMELFKVGDSPLETGWAKLFLIIAWSSI